MQIEAISKQQCGELLTRVSTGRLACSLDNQPYVVPVSFAYDDGYIYIFSTLGRKIEWMRANPKVCLQVDEIGSQSSWTSVVITGAYKELPEPQYAAEREHARARLGRRSALRGGGTLPESSHPERRSLLYLPHRLCSLWRNSGQVAWIASRLCAISGENNESDPPLCALQQPRVPSLPSWGAIFRRISNSRGNARRPGCEPDLMPEQRPEYAQWWRIPLAERREQISDLAIETIFFRIEIESMTGLRAMPEAD